MGRTIPGS
ncbi:rCG57380 [Rattus norvegicus]|uniref:RCG57380 n=1 Tax=Rattus norvegicus TaxID=10116 RepID=A6JP83_RAT|nr:rCG57380 [Rattus norvegicus]